MKNIQTSIDLTVSIGGAATATSTAAVGKNEAKPRKVGEGEVILVSFVCAAVLLFLC